MLRQELESATLEGIPSRFRGHSDTEILLAAVERWGLEQAVRRFVGMFAFALWDRAERHLHLVRDRLGEKPLYYGWTKGKLLFGSEIKSLRVHPSWQGEIDRDALNLFLRYNYIPAPYSIYKGILKLLPGTILTFSAQGQETMPNTVEYWSAKEHMEKGVTSPYEGSEREAIDHLDILLRDSVAQQMLADVPVGAFLSGGIDSSTVVAMMQSHSNQPVRTFTIGFGNTTFNEAKFAREVSQHLGTDHTELYLSANDALECIGKLPELYDEPFADSSQIPTYLISQLARTQVAVSLSGDGGDELFAGYHRYLYGNGIWGRTRWIPEKVRAQTAVAMQSVSVESWDSVFRSLRLVLPSALKQYAVGERIHKLGDVLPANSPETMYLGFVSEWQDAPTIVLGASEPLTGVPDRTNWNGRADFIQRMTYLDIVGYLPDDILVKVDRASMGVGLEVRVPFLDHRIVEFATRLPTGMKIRNGHGKWLLRQVLYRYVPKELIERPKWGFGLPLDEWLRGPLKPWASELLSEKYLQESGFFDPIPVLDKWNQHASGKRNWGYALWSVLMFQAWLSSVTSTISSDR
jgi:asparagine synthase (glutamine-hydrolysing)